MKSNIEAVASFDCASVIGNVVPYDAKTSKGEVVEHRGSETSVRVAVRRLGRDVVVVVKLREFQFVLIVGSEAVKSSF